MNYPLKENKGLVMGKRISERQRDFWRQTVIFSIALNILLLVILFGIRAVDKQQHNLYIRPGEIVSIQSDTESVVILFDNENFLRINLRLR